MYALYLFMTGGFLSAQQVDHARKLDLPGDTQLQAHDATQLDLLNGQPAWLDREAGHGDHPPSRPRRSGWCRSRGRRPVMNSVFDAGHLVSPTRLRRTPRSWTGPFFRIMMAALVVLVVFVGLAIVYVAQFPPRRAVGRRSTR